MLLFFYALFDPRSSIVLAQFFVFYLFGLVALFSYDLYREKHILSRYFISASIFYIGGNILVAIFYLGLLPYNDFTFNIGTLGVYLEATVLAYMLSFRIKYLENENEKKESMIKEVEYIAITDALTGIYNRRYFNEIIPKIINSRRRNGEIVSFLMMDIDHFKQYNDTYGHQMGDDVLEEFGKCFTKLLNRKGDYSFRLGGEEFGIIFNSTTMIEAENFAEKVRESIENLKIEHSGNSASQFVTVSIGLVCLNSNNNLDESALYKKTDELLYRAKEEGRNRVVSNITANSAIHSTFKM